MKRAAFLLTALLVVAASRATVLTYQGGTNGIDLYMYGDRATEAVQTYGTLSLAGGASPTVTVSQRNLDGFAGRPIWGSMYPWGAGYGDLSNAIYHNNGGYGEIALIADPGTTVTLQSFDIAGYPGTNQTGPFLRVISDSGILLDESNHVAPGTGRRTVNINATGQWFSIRFGTNYNVGISNVRFTSSETNGYVVAQNNMALGYWQVPGQLEGYMEFLNPNTMEVVGSVPTWTSRNGWTAGKWLGTVPPGTYVVRVKPGLWLSKLTGPVTLSGTNNVRVSLSGFLRGDVDGDNEVGPGDFSMLAMAFQSSEGDPNWNERADLDFDLEIGPGDFSILATNFLLAGE